MIEIAVDCTKAWYNEVINPGYNYANPNNSPANSHFTQLVWKSSTRIGLGLSMSKFNDQFNAFFCVAQYTSAGNVLNSFSQNVLAPIY